jgi:hypothetical protein
MAAFVAHEHTTKSAPATDVVERIDRSVIGFFAPPDGPYWPFT